MAEQNEQPNAQFGIQKIYCKDLSVETPNSPEIFTQEWKPETKLNIGTEHKQVAEGVRDAGAVQWINEACGKRQRRPIRTCCPCKPPL